MRPRRSRARPPTEPVAPGSAPLSVRDAEVVVYIDSDVIVAASLDPVLDRREHGSICAFPDIEDRFFPEWEETFDLRAPLRRQRYVNTGLVAFSTDQHPSLLRRWGRCCDRIRDCAGTADGQGRRSPTGLPDQDALQRAPHVGVRRRRPRTPAREWHLTRPPCVASHARSSTDRRSGAVATASRSPSSTAGGTRSRGRSRPVATSNGPHTSSASGACSTHATWRCDRRRRAAVGSRPVSRDTRLVGPPGVRRRLAARRGESSGRSLPRVRRDGSRILNAGAQPVRSIRGSTRPKSPARVPREVTADRSRHHRGCAGAARGASFSIFFGTWLVIGVVVVPFAAQAARLAWRGRSVRGRAQGWPRGSLRRDSRNDVDPGHLGALHPPPRSDLQDLVARQSHGVHRGPGVRLAIRFKAHADDLKHVWVTVERFVPAGASARSTASRSRRAASHPHPRR